MKRTTVSLTDSTFQDVAALADALGCSRSALVEVILSRSRLKHLRARLAFLRDQAVKSGPVRRYIGASIDEIEESIDYLESNYQGELWDAFEQH